MVPADALAPITTVPFPHLEDGDVLDILGIAFTVKVTALLLAVELVVQLASEVNVTVT